MTWTVQLDPPAEMPDRVMLDLNSGPIRVDQAGIDWGQAAITAYETQQGQWGNSVSDFVVPNRTVTIPLGLGMDDSGTEEIARAQLQQKVGLLQREGGVLLRQRAGGPAQYADIVNASLTVPDVWGETGDVETGVQLVLETLPDFYGDEVALDAINATGVCSTVLTQGGQPAVIAGDYSARTRIVVTDKSGQYQHSAAWAFRSRYHDAAASAAAVYEAEAFTMGLEGKVVALAGASGGSAVQVQGSGTVLETPLSAGAVNLTHRGIYRMLARVYTTSTNPGSLQVLWGAAAAPNQVNALSTIPAAAVAGTGQFGLMDLGVVNLPAIPVGASTWGFILKYAAPAAGAQAVSVDQVILQPLAESAGSVEDLISGVANVGLMLPDGSVEIRTDGAFKQVQTGANPGYWPVMLQVGDLPRLPPSGAEGRPAEIFVRPSRSTVYLSNSPNAPLADALDPYTVQVFYRPCWLGRP